MAEDYDVIRDHISRVLPGFEDFNERIRNKNGFVLPNPPRDTRSFATDIGRGRFTVSPLEYLEAPEGHLILQTMRSHDQYNTTFYGLDDRYRGISNGRRVVLVHPEDLASWASRTATSWTSSARSGARSGGPTGSGWSPTRRRGAAPRPTSRKPTPWSTGSSWPGNPTLPASRR